MVKILVKRNKMLTLAKNIYWTFWLLLLPSSAKIKMQMSNNVLLGKCIHIPNRTLLDFIQFTKSGHC